MHKKNQAIYICLESKSTFRHSDMRGSVVRSSWRHNETVNDCEGGEKMSIFDNWTEWMLERLLSM